jgi:chromosomal replication initiator protein
MPHDPTASTSWETISQRLQQMLNAGTYTTWFGNAQALEQEEDRLVVTVPNEFTLSWIEGHFSSLLDAAAAEHELVVELRVAVTEAAAQAREADIGEVVEAPAAAPDVVEVEVTSPITAATGINPKYTFDVFVIGASNRFAHAAALAVAESPAQSYNPLFIHGSTGLGKTHLLQAIGHYVLQQHPRLNVRYVTTETVLNEFVDSMRDGRMVNFKQRYRTYDLLMVDDIQFIEGKERLQEEFFHTFNSLYEAGKQIVLSSDRPPHELATLESRLRSRFQWGLITDVQPPDLETRIAILRKKVMTEAIEIGDPQVLTYIADRVTTNIRELEGALTRVVAYASLTGRPISPEVAEEVLRDLFPQGATRPITIEQIQGAVSEIFHLSIAELRGDRRQQSIAYPRHIAMYLCRELTDASLPKIGAKFGGRDHSTVLHGVNKITRLLKEDREAFNVVQELTTRIKQGR